MMALNLLMNTGSKVLENKMSKVVLITTGGTIASAKISHTKGVIPALTGKELLSKAGIKNDNTVQIIDFVNEDSSRLGPDNWLELSRLIAKKLAESMVSGVVVTHGTDTLAEAAFFLALTLPKIKPVIITGAMFNTSELKSDGERNLKQSLRLAGQSTAPKEVQIYFNGKVISPYQAEKRHTQSINSISSVNKQQFRNICFKLPDELPKVPLVASFAGDDGTILEYVAANKPMGIVVEALGSGNVSSQVETVLQKALKDGIKIVISSKVPLGEVTALYGGKGGALSLMKQGAIIARWLRGGKARILLMLGLVNNLNNSELKKIFQ
jgi:L-asparaginase